MEQDTLDIAIGAEQVNLDDLATMAPAPLVSYPENGLKMNASTAAFLSKDPAKVLENYQAIIEEYKVGQNSYTKGSVIGAAKQTQDAKDKQGLMSILADPNIPIEQKRAAIAGIASPQLVEPSSLIAAATYEQASDGENVEQEDVRISGADQFAVGRAAKENVQGMLNQHALTLSQGGAATFGDFLATIAPFATNLQTKKLLDQYSGNLTNASSLKGFMLPGSVRKEIFDALERMPMDKKVEASRQLLTAIENTPGIYFGSENKFAQYEEVKKFLIDGYTGFDKFLDNAVGVLDLVGLGGIAKLGIGRVTKLYKPTEQTVQAAATSKVVVEASSPVSPINIVKESNPQKSRELYAMVAQSPSEETAIAVAGTSRAGALAEQNLPQIGDAAGAVEKKIAQPERDLNTVRKVEPEEEIADAADDIGAIQFSAEERMNAANKVTTDLMNVKGLTTHDNMVSVRVDGADLKIDALYGTSEGGFVSGRQALDQAKLSFREYGFDERDLTLMKLQDGQYTPVDITEALDAGDYMVKLDTKHRINYFDITDPEAYTVKRNFFDRIPFLRSKKSGTVANTILDHASMLDPRLTGGAVVSAGQASRLDKLMVQMHSRFSDKYKAFTSDRQEKVYDYIKEANWKGLDHNVNDLIGRGFNKQEIDALQDWRQSWDTMFWFENRDMAKTLSNQGYQLIDNGTDKLVARPTAKNSNIGKVYDPSSGKVVSLDQQQLDLLYQSGGTYAHMRRPINVNGVDVEYAIARNTPTEYLRGIRDTDQILNYRPGYYQVFYKAPKFVDEIVRDTSGKEMYRRAIGVAGSTDEANQLRIRSATTSGKNPDTDYLVRDSKDSLRIDSDEYWDLNSAAGRVAQRHRGQRLEESTTSPNRFNDTYIEDPTTSAIRASRSLSQRIAMRDFIEASKARAMDQYPDYFREVNGRKQWVNNSNNLKPTTSAVSGDIADARTTVEYLNFLDSGYVNALDESFKAGFNAVANMLSGVGFTKAEKAALWMGTGEPTNFLKNGVFQAYIALNPFRQFLIQGHQIVRLMGYNPQYMISGAAAIDTQTVLKYVSDLAPRTSMTAKEKELVDFVEASGMLAEIDKSNLVRGSLTDMAETGNKITRGIGTALAIPRKLGFDLGEGVNRTTHLLAIRDKYVKAGKNVNDKNVRAEIYSTAESLTYDMNFAGDMAYNQNAASLFMQFFQVPHKAFMNVTTNRRLSGSDKIKFAITDMALWGIPGYTILENLLPDDMKPQDPKAREALNFGAESVAYNALFSQLAGKEIKVDFSGLSPYGIEGFAHLAHAITSGGMGEFISNTPAFSLYAKDGSKMGEAFGRFFSYLGFTKRDEAVEPETALSVLKGFAEFSSGISNLNKAALIYEQGQVTNKKGGILMEDADWAYAAAQILGFKSMQEVLGYRAQQAMFKGTDKFKADVDEMFNLYAGLLTRDQKTLNSEPEFVNKMLSIMQRQFNNDPKTMEYVNQKLSKLLVDRQDSIINQAVRFANIPTADESAADLYNLGIITENQKDDWLDLYKNLREQAREQGTQ
jgi:hypothetical protein